MIKQLLYLQATLDEVAETGTNLFLSYIYVIKHKLETVSRICRFFIYFDLLMLFPVSHPFSCGYLDFSYEVAEAE